MVDSIHPVDGVINNDTAPGESSPGAVFFTSPSVWDSHSHGVPLSLQVEFFSASHMAFCWLGVRPRDWI